jgi:hypothetical protein
MSFAPYRPLRLRRRRGWLRLSALIGVMLVILGGLAVATDVLGAGQLFDRAVAKIDRIMAGPVPDRATVDTVLVTPRPATAQPSPTRAASSASAPGDPTGTAGPSPEPTPEPTPARVPVDLDVAADPAGIFASEVRDTWCSPAGVQITLAFLGKADTSVDFQR